jgi:hypothetical protein
MTTDRGEYRIRHAALTPNKLGQGQEEECTKTVNAENIDTISCTEVITSSFSELANIPVDF